MKHPVVRPLGTFLVAAATCVFALSSGPSKADESAALSSGTPVPIALTSYEFSPAHIELRRGRPYQLHLVNSSGKDHSFSSPDLFASSTIAPGDEAKIRQGAVEVDSGSSVDVLLVPLTPGDYAVKCTHFLHATFGMHGTVTVR